MRRRRREPPVPPPIGAVAIDGSNVVANGIARAQERLRLAVDWARTFRPDLPIRVFLDAATWRRLDDDARAALQGELDRPRQLELRIGPPSAPVDPTLLLHAHEQRALVLSNDRYWEHEELRRGVVTLQFVLARAQFRPYDEGTWFLPQGAASRVPLEVLRSRGAGADTSSGPPDPP